MGILHGFLLSDRIFGGSYALWYFEKKFERNLACNWWEIQCPTLVAEGFNQDLHAHEKNKVEKLLASIARSPEVFSISRGALSRQRAAFESSGSFLAARSKLR